jgi:hypothetical protein
MCRSVVASLDHDVGFRSRIPKSLKGANPDIGTVLVTISINGIERSMCDRHGVQAKGNLSRSVR